MARGRKDLQLVWIVVGSLGFWAAIWQHDVVLDFARSAWKIASAMLPSTK